MNHDVSGLENLPVTNKKCVLVKDGMMRMTETSRDVTKPGCLAQSLDSHKNVASSRAYFLFELLRTVH